MKLVGLDYINIDDKKLVEEFINSSTSKKYILGVNKLAKKVAKLVEVVALVDDFTRVQSSKKKSILNIEELPKDALILCAVLGSPLEVIKELDKRGFRHFNYLAFYKYSNLELLEPPFICDFKDDFIKNEKEYEKTYELLGDKKSKDIFTKVLNFKQSFDFKFMEGFTNNHKEQYFDKELIPKIKNISFVDGGSYVGDTLAPIIDYFPDFKKIYAIEPSSLHINIAKRDFIKYENIEFINCGLGKEKIENKEVTNKIKQAAHDYQAVNINTIDALICDEVDYIKLDIEGAEQDALIGAINTIKQYHPILAVCIYHKAQDWYKVPQIVLDIRVDYDIYLRHYMEGIYETVMYFIPKKS